MDNQSIPTERGVGNIIGFQQHVLPHSHHSQITKIPEVLYEQTYPFGLATALLEFTRVVKEVKLIPYKDLPVPRRLVVETLLAMCRDLGWVVDMKKSELTPQQDFNFVSHRFDLLTGWVLTTQERWLALQQKLQFFKSKLDCTVRQFMSLIDLLPWKSRCGQLAST